MLTTTEQSIGWESLCMLSVRPQSLRDIASELRVSLKTLGTAMRTTALWGGLSIVMQRHDGKRQMVAWVPRHAWESHKAACTNYWRNTHNE